MSDGMKTKRCHKCREEIPFGDKMCGHCGAKQATPIQGLIAIAIVASLLWLFFADGDKTAQATTATLSITLDDFIDRYNQAYQTMDIDNPVLHITKESDNGKLITAQATTGNNVAFVLAADNRTRALQSVTLIGGASKDEIAIEAGAKVFIASYAMVMAIEDPFMSIDERNSIRIAKQHLEPGQTLSWVRHGVKYTRMLSDGIGYMMFAEVP